MPADIGIGILIAIAVSKIFKVNLSTRILFISILFALLPDIDFILSYFKGLEIGKWSHLHRNLLHYPLLYISVGFIILRQIGKKWAYIFGVGSLWHFIHDAVAIGWGVKWLYPFSDKNFILYQADIKDWFLSLSDSQIIELANLYGRDNWISYYYFSWHPIGVAEASVFMLALIVLSIAKGWVKIEPFR